MSEKPMSVEVKKITPYLWEIPKKGDMLVPGRIYGDEETIQSLLKDVEEKRGGGFTPAIVQVLNVAMLPGIQKASIAMADIHPGYGFAIGGVGAFDLDEGVISVAGVGFDINCGVRVLRTPLDKEDVEAKKEQLANQLFRDVPAGVGSTGDIRLTREEIDEVLIKGADFAVKMGYGFPEDLEYIEENGKVGNADPDNVSKKAKDRQFKQVGTLGSGNHYLEVQYVEEVYDIKAADAYGIRKNQILIAIHCGSRALGHQIGTDYLQTLSEASRKYNIPIRERELVCAPFKSHEVDGKMKKLLVHRKGATRAFAANRDEVPIAYRDVGQPLLVGGTMGTASYILCGTQKGMEDCCGSAVHGAGSAMSWERAKRQWRGEELIHELAEKGILIKSRSRAGVAEEAPGAYKDVDKVVNIVHSAGINKKVAKVRPLICVKG